MNDSFSFVILCHVLDDLNGTTEKNLTLFRRVERRDMVDDNYVHHLINIERVLPYICVSQKLIFSSYIYLESFIGREVFVY